MSSSFAAINMKPTIFSRVIKKTLPALLFFFLALLISVDNSKLVNNFFYICLLIPALVVLVKEKIRPTFPASMIGIYLIYIALSTLWGTGDLMTGMKQLKYVVYILAFAVLIHKFASPPERVALVAAGGLIIGLLLEGHSLYLQFSSIGVDNWLAAFPRLEETTGPFNPVYLALCIGLFGFILIASKVDNPWISTALICALILVTLPLQSRTMILSLVVAHGYLMFRRRDFRVLSLWVILSLASSVALLFSIDRFTGPIYRDDIWLISLTTYLQDCSILLGCGNRHNFGTVIDNIYFYNPHSIVLSQLLYGGVLGVLFLLATLWIINKEARHTAEHWKPVFLYCALASLPIGHTLLTHPDFIWILIWLPLGLSGILFRPDPSPGSPGEVPAR